MIRIALLFLTLALPATAQEAEPPMTIQRLSEIILTLDPQAQPSAGGIELTIEDVPVLVVFDVSADRMRAMVPIARVDGLSPDDLIRLMQANFDTALDARYAIARDQVWGVYIHPLSPLKRTQFLSGLAQTVNLARTYGTLYSGGAAVFGRGDSNELYQNLLEDLLGRGQEL